MEEHFKSLIVANWKQFENVKIDFHDRLTVLTGANGSGKSTLLRILAQHFNTGKSELATPVLDEKTDKYQYRTVENQPDIGESVTIGYIAYRSGGEAKLSYVATGSVYYSVVREENFAVEGFFIPSHRQVYQYTGISSLATSVMPRAAVHGSALSEVFSNNNSGQSSFSLKTALINWANMASGSKRVKPDKQAEHYIDEFEEILRQLLPDSIGFLRFDIRSYELVLVTKSGDFLIEAVSGGISAIIEVSWLIYTKLDGDLTRDFTVIVDEIENHLHPSLQRAILPNLLRAFPKCRFIVSTHSPLIVGSVLESYVYALRFEGGSTFRVLSHKLDLSEKAKDALEILNEVLGVSVTIPMWAEQELNKIIDRYSTASFRPTLFKEMRADLQLVGLEALMPQALEKVVQKND